MSDNPLPKYTPVFTRVSPAEPTNTTPTLDTSAYASGDILFVPTEIAGVTLVSGGYARLAGLTIFDGDAQAAAMDILLLQASTSLGTINEAPDITDANLDPPNIQQIITVNTTDYVAVSGAEIVTLTFDEPLPVNPSATSMWIAAISRGAPTHTASGIVLTTWWTQ